MNIQKIYSLLQKKKNPIKEQFTSKLCPTIFNGIKIAIQKCEQKKNLKYPYAYHNTHSGKRKKENYTNGKITIMIDKRERKENVLAYSLL